MNYILKDGKPIAVDDVLEWALWFETAERVVAKDDIGGAHISTIFLGIDYNFDSGPPVLWETMIFGGEHDEYQERYTSEKDARAGHKRAVELAGG